MWSYTRYKKVTLHILDVCGQLYSWGTVRIRLVTPEWTAFEPLQVNKNMDPYKEKEKQYPNMRFEIFQKSWEVKWKEIELELIFWAKLEFEVHKEERNNCNGLVK